MKNKKLERWRPCQSYCQMNGAAAAVLSFKNANVVFNGPRWCSVIAERELMSYDRTLTERLYCSHIEQSDLLFGTGERIRDIIEDQNRENPETSLLAILTSCSVGLIGDDVNGIVNSIEQTYPILVLDAGGLTGLFEEGYQTAMIEILKKLHLEKSSSVIPGRVNLLGYCNYYPNSNGDLRELKRLLRMAGFEVGVCPGESGQDIQKLKNLPTASLNIVLSTELGLGMAKYLKDIIGQEYVVLPVPYGIEQTMEWIRNISKTLSVTPNMAELEKDAQIMLENVTEQVDMLKRTVSNLTYRRAILALPYSQAKSLAKALQNEILEVEKIKFELQGNFGVDESFDNDETVEEKPWLSSDYQLLFGSAADRARIQEFARTIYINMHKKDSRIQRKLMTFAGIEGWGMLIQNIIDQTLTLHHLKEGEYRND